MLSLRALCWFSSGLLPCPFLKRDCNCCAFPTSFPRHDCNSCVFPTPFLGRDWKCCVFPIPFPGRNWKCYVFPIPFSGCDWKCCVFPVPFPGRDWKCCVFPFPFSGCDWKCCVFPVPFPGCDWKCCVFPVPFFSVYEMHEVLCFSSSLSLSQFPSQFPSRIPCVFSKESALHIFSLKKKTFLFFLEKKLQRTFLGKHRESAKGTEKGTGKGTGKGIGRELGKGKGTGKTQDFVHFVHAEEKELEKHSIFNHSRERELEKLHFQSHPRKGTGKTAFSITPGKGNCKNTAFSIKPGKGTGKTRQLQARPEWELEKHSMWEDLCDTDSWSGFYHLLLWRYHVTTYFLKTTGVLSTQEMEEIKVLRDTWRVSSSTFVALWPALLFKHGVTSLLKNKQVTQVVTGCVLSMHSCGRNEYIEDSWWALSFTFVALSLGLLLDSLWQSGGYNLWVLSKNICQKNCKTMMRK